MVSFFPIPHTDECLQSLVLRYHIFSWNKSIDYSVKSLTGLSSNSIFGLIPRGLKQLIENIDKCYHCDIHEFIDNYTILPFADFFWGQFMHDAIMSIMSGSTFGENRAVFYGLTATMFKKPYHLKFCECCSYEDFHKFGYPYLRRSHQLPFVTRCYIHGELLRPASFLYKSLWPEKDRLICSNNITTSVLENDSAFEVKYAKWSHQLLSLNKKVYKLNNIYDIIQAELLNQGYDASNASTAYYELKKKIITKLDIKGKTIFDDVTLYDYSLLSKDWVYVMIKNGLISCGIEVPIIMLMYLFDTVENLLQRCGQGIY